MTIDKAIELLKSELPNTMPNNPPRRLEAVKLGIEALKRLKATREYPSHVIQDRLIGETEE